MSSSRRDVLTLFPAAALAVFAQEPKTHFPAAARQRLAVTSYPFRTYINSPGSTKKASRPGMDLTAFPKFVAENFGVMNINPLGSHFRSTDPGYLDAFRSALDKAGSHIVDLGLGGKDFYSRDPAVQQDAVASSSKWIDIAAQIGSPSVRQHLHVSKGEKPLASVAAGTLSRLAEYGAKRNIVVNLENDDAISEDPFVIVEAIEKVNSPYLRALPDFGNALIAHDAEYSANGVAAMLKHAYNMCHVKDTVQTDKGQLLNVDLKRMFALAKQHSYAGYYSMEFDTDAGDPIAGTKHLVEQSLQYLA